MKKILCLAALLGLSVLACVRQLGADQTTGRWTSEDPQRVHDTIQAIASEGLTLLWPDLDRLADAEDSDVAHHAREALERLSEEMERSRD